MIRVDIHYDHVQPKQAGVYRRCQKELASLGFRCRFFNNVGPSVSSRADLFIVHPKWLPSEPSRFRRPIIVDEPNDMSHPRYREILKLPQVPLITKLSVVNPELRNAPSTRAHAWLLEGERSWPDIPIISQTEYLKLVPGVHFGMFSRLRPWVDRAISRRNSLEWRHRSVDAMFIGLTSYDVAAITRHRQQFYRALSSIRELNIISIDSPLLLPQDYFRISQTAKIIISPWGYGELCYRDFEAMLDDCVLVKPRTDFIRVLDNALTDGTTYISCAHDASDLESIIRSILDNDRFNSAYFERNRQKAIEWWSPSWIARWLVEHVLTRAMLPW